MTVRRARTTLAATVFAVLFAQVLLYPGITDLVALWTGTPAAENLAATGLDAGRWFLAAEFVGFVLVAGLWGALSDALGRRVALITAGALGGAVGYAALAGLALAEAPFEVVLVVRFLQGALTIGAFSLAMTMLMDLSGGHGRNMGAAGIAIGLGTALGAPVGGQLSDADPLAPVVAASVLLVVPGLLVLTVPDRAPRGREGALAALSRLRDRPALSLPYAFGFIDRLTAGFFALVGTVYFRSAFGLDAGETGLLLGAFFAPFALLQYPMGIVSDRIGRRIPIALGSTLYGVVVVSVAFAPTVPLVALLLVLTGVTGAFMSPATMALVSDLAADEERGVAMGGYNIVGSFGFLVGIVGGGALASAFGFTVAFVVVGLSEICLAALAVPALSRVEATRVALFESGESESV
ncbi:MFS transporter [Halomarina ordinaria]|uniref:MFS transporter n=1 Tax=Halomarina ordinaria TaxID=3033939 RepID=A0ABD5UAA7_9EURY|nr:MFS transporter [Halomarina sp. PSRA2]